MIMGFFGEVIDEEPLSLPIEDGYHVTLLQATIVPDEIGADAITLYLKASHSDDGLPICTLYPSKQVLNCMLSHEFSCEDGPVEFWTDGGKISLTGKWSWDPDADSHGEYDEEEEDCDHDHDHEDDDEEDDEEEVEEDETPQLVSVPEDYKATTTATALSSSNKKRKANEIEETAAALGEGLPSEITSGKNNKKKSQAKKMESAVAATAPEPAASTTSTAKKGSKEIKEAPAAIDVDTKAEKSKPLLKPWKLSAEQVQDGIEVPAPKIIYKDGGKQDFYYSDYIVGRGKAITPGAVVKILYDAFLVHDDSNKKKGDDKQQSHLQKINATLFDSRQKKKDPFTFRLGLEQVIAGLDRGLEGMRVGGAREISIPARFGYGKKGHGIVPGNQQLLFRVRLIDTEK